MFAKKIICFDIGGTKILKAVVKIKGNKYEFLDIQEEKNPRREEKIKNILLSYCRKAGRKFRTEKVAISTTRIVDPMLKVVYDTKDRYGVSSFSFQFLEKNGFSLKVENDGQCFALGECYFGKTGKVRSALTLTIGTGIGGGFVSKKNIFSGAHNSALEVSHSKFYYNGKWKEWAELAAGRGIENRYRNFSGKKTSAKEIFTLASSGDIKVQKIIKNASEAMGIGIANILNILDPELIVFGGSLSKQKKFVGEAIKIAKKNVFNKHANYKFAVSSLGNKANLLGAASLYKK